MVTINGPSPDFTLTAASSTLTIKSAAQGTDMITIAPVNGPFLSAIQLSCTVSGTSPMPTCAMTPASVTPGENSPASTLTMTASASAKLAPAIHPRSLGLLYAGWLPLLTFGMTLMVATKKGQRRWVPCGLLLSLVLLLAACGGSNGGTQPAPGTYTVIVTGSSGATQHMTQVVVAVQ